MTGRVVEVAVTPGVDGALRSGDIIMIAGRAESHRIELRADGVAAIVQVPPEAVAFTSIIGAGDTVVVTNGGTRATFRLP